MILLLAAFLFVALLALALHNGSKRDYFNELEWSYKYNDRDEWSKRYVNDDSGHCMIGEAKMGIDGIRYTVINDGYGNGDAPYESWQCPHFNKPDDFRDYVDVEGWLTKEEIAKQAKKYV